MWARLVSQGGPLDERGGLAHVRATTLLSLRTHHRHWLRWLGNPPQDQRDGNADFSRHWTRDSDEQERFHRRADQGRAAPGHGGPACREHGISTATLYECRARYGGMDPSMVSPKALEGENRRLRRMFADLSMQADLLEEALERSERPAQRHELAAKAVATTGAQHCPALGVSETCFRCGSKRDEESETMADLLVGSTNVRDSGCASGHLRNVRGACLEPQARASDPLRSGAEPAHQGRG